MATICETVTIFVDDGQTSSTHVVPAYTVTRRELKARVEQLLSDYVTGSSRARTLPSLGDFALYLIAQASQDPREMP